jgi:hypothetical protein
LTITSPNGSELWYPRESRTITWTSVGTIPNTLKLEYTKDGTAFTTIATGEANDGAYPWTVPWDISDTVKAKISIPFSRFFKDATDYDFGLGTLSSTAISGTGAAAKVQLATSSTPAWQRLSPTGGPPGTRASHAAAFDSASRKVHPGWTECCWERLLGLRSGHDRVDESHRTRTWLLRERD